MSISSAPSATAPPDLGETQVEVRQSRRERAGHARHLDARPGNRRGGDADERRVDAHCGDRRHGGVERVGPNGFAGEGADLPGRVGAFERREVDAPDGELERGCLRRGLDRTSGKGRGPCLEHHRVDGGDADAAAPRARAKAGGGNQLDGHRGMRTGDLLKHVRATARRHLRCRALMLLDDDLEVALHLRLGARRPHRARGCHRQGRTRRRSVAGNDPMPSR